MHNQLNSPAISPLRQRLIDDMNLRHFGHETQRNYLRDIGRLANFLGRSPDTATVDDLRRFQIWQQSEGVPVPTMNSVVSALRFFFNTTVDRPDLARRLVRLAHPRKLPVVLSREEVTRLLDATTCLKHQAALGLVTDLRLAYLHLRKNRLDRRHMKGLSLLQCDRVNAERMQSVNQPISGSRPPLFARSISAPMR
ncbi:MAG: phage integrase N-terminal SAM-like domain-containing protein [Mesorhizobium sp.]